jgi:molecular chaperone IbpA
MRTYDLTPLFRSTIGFDRWSDLFDAALRADENGAGYPPYNIEKMGDDKYRIMMAVAGFGENDIEITAVVSRKWWKFEKAA